MFNPRDRVLVKQSNSGYVGPGVIVDRAYGIHYLVQVENHCIPIICVKATQLCHDRSSAERPKKTKK